MKKLIVFSFIILCIVAPQLLHAEIIINEIMYDLDGTDTDREWIEVVNTGSSPVDLSTYKFFEANTNHSLVPDGASSIPAGGFAIIADTISKFKADWPNYNGLLFDSSFSLNNDPGETLAIKDTNNTIINQVSYTADPSGAGAGKSLQKNGESWVIAAPTPGAANAAASDTNASGSDANGASNGNTSSGTSPVTSIKKPVEKTEPKRSAEILGKTLVTTRSIVEFEPKVLDFNTSIMTRGKFVWNFGDGASEIKSSNEKIQHTYYYPGEYVVTLDYFSNPYVLNLEPDASDRFMITVENHKLAIASFDEEGNITISNGDTKEFDVSNWSLVSGSKSFLLPLHTIILPSKSLFFPHEITGFQNVGFANTIELHTKDNLVASTFPVQKKAVFSSKSTLTSYYQVLPKQGEVQKEEVSIIPIAAAALETQAINTEANKSSGTISVVTLATIVVLASASTLYFRHKQRKDEEADADDIAIVDS